MHINFMRFDVWLELLCKKAHNAFYMGVKRVTKAFVSLWFDFFEDLPNTVEKDGDCL